MNEELLKEILAAIKEGNRLLGQIFRELEHARLTK